MSLRAGFAEIDITPEPWKRLCGMPGLNVATDTRWPLHGRVSLFDDGNQRLALVILDLVGVMATSVREWRAALSDVGRLAPDEISVMCTHTHNGPTSIMDADYDYLDFVGE